MANQFTTKEVLNKVLLDSSGNSVAANSHTSQEALNAVLDTSNNRLNVSLGGSNTISGDVTITGDLTVQGSATNTFDEQIQGIVQILGSTGTGATPAGTLQLTTSETTIVDNDQLGRIEFLAASEADGSDSQLVGASIAGEAEATFAADNNSTALVFSTNTSAAATERMRIDSSGNVGIGTVSPYSPLHVKSSAEGSVGGLEATDGTFIPQVVIEGSGTTAAKMSPTLALFNSSTGADGDTLGSIMFIGGDDSNQPPSTIAEGSVYAGILAKITDETNSSNDGELHFLATKGNDNTNTAMSIVGSKVGIGVTPVGTLDVNISTDARGSFTDTIGEIGSGVFALQVINAAGSALKPMGIRAEDIRLVTGSAIRLKLEDNSRISLSNNDAGSGNTIFGELAGNSIQSGGNNNVIIGDDAGLDLTTADENVLVGKSAGANLTTSDDNVAIGASALATEVDGTRNVAVGYQSLTAQDGSSSTYNTALGYVSGDVVTTGTQNTLIGAITDPSANNGTNQTVIGYNATGVADNSVTLGNADVTAVYMAQDSGATVHARHMNLIDSADNSSGGFLNLKNDRANPADNDETGRIYMYADDDGGNPTEAILMIGRLTDVSNGNEDSDLRMYTMLNGAQKETLTLSSGVVNLPQGQLNFPDSQNASADARTLDDYEEGTFTPAFDNLTEGSATLSGKYTKIGNLVYVQGQITWAADTSASGTTTVTNLPFTVANDIKPQGQIEFLDSGAALYFGFCQGSVNTTTLNLHKATTSGDSLSVGSVTEGSPFTWANGDRLVFEMTYRV